MPEKAEVAKLHVAVEFEKMPSGHWVAYLMFSDEDSLQLFQKVYSRLNYSRVLERNRYRLEEGSAVRALALLSGENGRQMPYQRCVPEPKMLLGEDAEKAVVELLNRLAAEKTRREHEELGVRFLPAREQKTNP